MRIGKSSRSAGRRSVSTVLRSLPDFMRLLMRLLRDPRVARMDKVLVGLAITYILAPADLIPDFLGFMGWVDDVYLLGLALNRLIARAGMDIVLEHWRGSSRALSTLLEELDDIGAVLPAPVRGAVRKYLKRGLAAADVA